MKYEINNKGQIGICPEMGKDDSTYVPNLLPSKYDLENILCAVKKTQEKQMNRVIQELQDTYSLVKVSRIDFFNSTSLYVDKDSLWFRKVDGTKVKLG